MAKQKSTKKALLSSVLSLVLCLSMLIGTTFAWFTDSVTSGRNIIASGNLDVELDYSKDGTTWNTVEGATEIFKKDALWEPGYAEVVYLEIKNAGSLDLKYQFAMNILSETTAKNVQGEDFKLSTYLQYGIVDYTGVYEEREDALAAVKNSSVALSDYSVSGNLLNGDSKKIALVVYMPTTVGNEANYRGDVIPTIDLGISLMATQMMSESDSFGPDYDKNATFVPAWDGTVTDPADLEKDANNVYQLNTAADLAGFAALVNGGTRSPKAVLTDDVNLGGVKFTPIGGVEMGQSGWDDWFNGTLDGQGHTIYGLNVQAPFAGLIGLSYGGTVKNLNIDGAFIDGGSYASGIVGYGYNTIENCKVTNSTFWASYAGSLVSYRGASIKNCTASNNTVVGWYTAGGICGLSGGEKGTIEGNKVTNCSIYLIDYNPTSTNRGAGDIVGHATNAETLKNNIASNNVVEILPYTSTTVVANAADLLEIGGTSKEGTILIVDDIDLAGAELATIGAAYGKELDVIGNGHTISNVNYAHTTHNGMKHYGMFYAYTNSTLTISDLIVENAKIDASNDTTRNYGVGIILCYTDGGSKVTLTNVDVHNSHILNDKPDIGDEAGVFVGYQTGTLVMKDCDSTGCSVKGETSEKTGAMIGMVNGTATLTNCTTDLTIGTCNRVSGTLVEN